MFKGLLFSRGCLIRNSSPLMQSITLVGLFELSERDVGLPSVASGVSLWRFMWRSSTKPSQMKVFPKGIRLRD